MVRADPENVAYQHDLAMSRHNVAFWLMKWRQTREALDEAEESLDDAIRIHTELSAKFRGFPDYRRELVRHYLALGDLQGFRERTDKAGEGYRKAVALADELARDFPEDPGRVGLFLEVAGGLVGWARDRHRLPETRQFLAPLLGAWRERAEGRPGGAALKARLSDIEVRLHAGPQPGDD